ncbi:hypothetical protein GCM10027612_44340 [Microbispora bryophytorum subsp. camponoti]
MAVIHHTTLTPGKLELLTSWLPAQPWYGGDGRRPELTKAGGFRLDDPQGEVGMEFMVVTDVSGDRPVSYHVPLTYRGRRWRGPTTHSSGRRSTASWGGGGSMTAPTIRSSSHNSTPWSRGTPRRSIRASATHPTPRSPQTSREPPRRARSGRPAWPRRRTPPTSWWTPRTVAGADG